MTEADELIKYINDFLKRPILPNQEAQIIAAIINGDLNVGMAKKLYIWVIEENLKAHNEFMKMSKEEILNLIEKDGVKNEIFP